jgi:hypothetical protein
MGFVKSYFISGIQWLPKRTASPAIVRNWDAPSAAVVIKEQSGRKPGAMPWRVTDYSLPDAKWQTA